MDPVALLGQLPLQTQSLLLVPLALAALPLPLHRLAPAALPLPLHGLVLCVSGRLSFELVQKAVVAGAAVLVGAGAPTSLAIALAAERGLTLAGFARGTRVNVYTAPERVIG